jgi:ankyrin repeat protein
VRANRVSDVKTLLATRPRLRREDTALLLGQAAEKSRAAVVRALLACAIDVRCHTVYGGTVLHDAARGTLDWAVRALLERGADARARDDRGRTPLHEAGSIRVAEALLAAGADAKARSKSGKTPAEMLAAIGRKDVARFVASAKVG